MGDRVATGVTADQQISEFPNIRKRMHAFLENTAICDLDFVFSVVFFDTYFARPKCPSKTVHWKLKPEDIF